MVWMQTFCFCCSVRLGVIVCGALSIMHSILICVVLIVSGVPIITSAKYFIKEQRQYSDDMFIWRMLDFLSENSSTYLAVYQSLIAAHVVNSSLAIYGALKLRKWLLVPYVLSQSFIAISGISQHVITMMVLKNVVNLEVLIGFTVMGTFFMVFLAYSGATAITLFQIIVLITSQEYKALYGEDPFSPKPQTGNGRWAIKDLGIFYISYKKESNRVQEMIGKRREGQAVIPVKPLEAVEESSGQDVNFSNWHLNEVVCVGKGIKKSLAF